MSSSSESGDGESSASSVDEEEASAEADQDSSSAPAADSRIALMAAEDFAPERWTQEYCSSHVNFCIPVHKNWYFKSFGALSSILWHVEIGPENVDELGDGPLTVELRTGDLASVGAKDGDLKEAGGKVTGYRSWSDSRHFAITGDAALREPVSFITKALRQGP